MFDQPAQKLRKWVKICFWTILVFSSIFYISYGNPILGIFMVLVTGVILYIIVLAVLLLAQLADDTKAIRNKLEENDK